MAAGQLPKRISQSLRFREINSHTMDLLDKVTCPVCLCLYLDPKLLLPCCHTLCSNCYATMYRQGDGQLNCPMCRQLITISSEEAKRNFAMDELVKEAQRAQRQLLMAQRSLQEPRPDESQDAEPSPDESQDAEPRPDESQDAEQRPRRPRDAEPKQLSCSTQPWDVVVVSHHDDELFCDMNAGCIVRGFSSSLMVQLPQDLIFCIGDIDKDFNDAQVFSVDGHLLVSNWRLQQLVYHQYDIHRIAFDTSSSLLILSDYIGHRVFIADLTGEVLNVIDDLHNPSACCVQQQPHNFFIVVDNGAAIRLYDASDGCVNSGISCDGFHHVTDAACDEVQLIVCDATARKLYILSCNHLTVLASVNVEGEPQFMTIGPSGCLLLNLRRFPSQSSGSNDNNSNDNNSNDNSSNDSSSSSSSSSIILYATAGLQKLRELCTSSKLSGISFAPAGQLLVLCNCYSHTIDLLPANHELLHQAIQNRRSGVRFLRSYSVDFTIP